MTHVEFLERQAWPYWMWGQPLPIDLFAKMNAAGMDVDALEREYKEKLANEQ